MCSYVLKGLISLSTAVLLGLIVMYHAREIQVGELPWPLVPLSKPILYPGEPITIYMAYLTCETDHGNQFLKNIRV